MLEFLRSRSGGLIAKLFIGLLAMSFAVWGISDIFRGYQGDALATVGDQEISTEAYRSALERQVRFLSQRTGQNITLEEARALGVHQQVLSELIREAALDDQARRLNLAASDEVVAKRIEENPRFRDRSGKFDSNGFRQLLASNGITEGQFVQQERRNVLRSELIDAVDTALSAPDTLKKAAWIYDNQKRGARFFIMPKTELPVDMKPSAADLKTYYDKNKRIFTAPEFRTLSLLRLQPEDVAETISINEDDAKAAYEKRLHQYSIPEKRTIEQLSFLTKEAAENARKRIVEGATFADIAKERGLSEKDYVLGTLAKSEVPDPAVALAAFGLDQGHISQPIAGALASALIRVTDIQLGVTQPFSTLKDRLIKDLKLEQAKEEILSIHDQIEDQRAGGSTFAEISRKLNLPLITVDGADATGNDPNGKPIVALPAQAGILKIAFESDVGVENDPVETPEDGFVWVDVIAVTPETLKPVEEVKDKIAELWSAGKLRELQLKNAEAMLAKTKSSATFDALAGEAGQTITIVPPTTRGGRAQGLGLQGLAAVFNTAKGSFALAPVPDNSGFMIVETTSAEVPPYQATDENATRVAKVLETGLTADMLQQYLGEVQESAGVNINPQIWSRFQNPGS